MDYIYHGEVQIFQDQIDTFLTVAQRLKIEGLLGQENVSEKEETRMEINVEEETQIFSKNLLLILKPGMGPLLILNLLRIS